jgi:hypothetical protein
VVIDEINAALEEAREAAKGEDVAGLREKVKALSNASMKIGEALSGSQQSANAPPEKEGEEPKKDGEEKKEEEKK